MMSAYRRVWTVLVCLLGSLGAIVALLAIEVGVVISVSLLAGVVTAVTHYSLSHGGTRARREDLIDFIGVGSAVGVVLAGYVELMGPYWIPGALAVVLLSPTVCCRLTQWCERLPAMAGFLAGPVATQPAAAMTVAELCLAWRSSFLALGRLRHDRDTVQRGQVVASRQQYLDELEARDPAGFARWLAEGAGREAIHGDTSGRPSGHNPGRHRHCSSGATEPLVTRRGWTN